MGDRGVVCPSAVARVAVERVSEAHLAAMDKLWRAQYAEARAALPVLPEEISTHDWLAEHARDGRGAVARIDGSVVGYMLYDAFPFHGEPHTFSPVIGHAAIASQRPAIYAALYRALASDWIRQRCVNHILMLFAHDVAVRQLCFQLGFGMHVVDTHRTVTPAPVPALPYAIRRATPADIANVVALSQASQGYFRAAPIFLARAETREECAVMLADTQSAVFLATVADQPIGMLHTSTPQETDITALVDPHTGMVYDTYIQPEHRGHGLGSALLQHAINWCHAQGATRLHVDFESANLFAASFWPKHFTPTIYSLRRHVNADIVEEAP